VSNLARFPDGMLRYRESHISRTVQRSDSREILLAVIGEVDLPSLQGLGTAVGQRSQRGTRLLRSCNARGAANQSEWLGRVRIRLQECPSGRVIDELAMQHTSSLVS